MSKENVKLFFEKMKDDNELKQQLYRLSGESHEELLEKTIEFAVKNGYEFNREELEQVTKELVEKSGELSDEEMAEISGGGSLMPLYRWHGDPQELKDRNLRPPDPWCD